MRDEKIKDALNDVGWEYADNDTLVSLNVFQIAMIQREMEGKVLELIDDWKGTGYQKDWAELYLELCTYVQEPLYKDNIAELLYHVEVSEGDNVVDILKRNPDTPDIWKRIQTALAEKHLIIDIKTGKIVNAYIN